MTFQKSFDESTFGAGSAIQSSGSQASGTTLDAAGVTRSAAMKLFGLLSCDPLDLGRISDEIRSHPDLDARVMRITASLAFLPEGYASSVEEAAVALGRDRLRILVDMWSSLRHESGQIVDNGVTLPLGDKAKAPETSYIAAFMHPLGTNSPVSASGRNIENCLPHRPLKEDLAELTGILATDLNSLIPFFGPVLEKDMIFANFAG
jgi:hypothetical protein